MAFRNSKLETSPSQVAPLFVRFRIKWHRPVTIAVKTPDNQTHILDYKK